jgi:glycosyltransferase involved in cell wall biosynthesis
MTPSISVVIPTYNRAASLERLLDALASSDLEPTRFEVIVVDDGSGDHTADVVERAPLPVRYLPQRNQGPASARNTGWRAASGPVVAFTDDDCVPEPGWLPSMLEEFSDVTVGGVGGRIIPLVGGFLADFVDAEGLVDHGRAVATDGSRSPTYLVTANAAFRRAALESVGGFDERFRLPAGEDVDLSERVTGAGWRLARTNTATVRHDHRVTPIELLRTYHRHGRGRAWLALVSSAQYSTGGARRVLTVSHWRDRIDRYRAGGRTTGRVCVFALIRCVGLVVYAAGLVQERARVDASR